MVAIVGGGPDRAVRDLRVHAVGGSRTGDGVWRGNEAARRGRSLLSIAADGFDIVAGTGAGGGLEGAASTADLVASWVLGAATGAPSERIYSRVRSAPARIATRRSEFDQGEWLRSSKPMAYVKPLKGFKQPNRLDLTFRTALPTMS